MKYSYFKSWPGMLRLLGGAQLVFGGMVVAFVIAYIQRDREWANFYNGTHNNSLSGRSYRGPMTPFVLAVVGLSWVVTLILLVMGMTVYYRTVLLDSAWWPLTEGVTNVALFLLYMSAGIVYLNDLKRGGLCYMTLGVDPVMAHLCRVDGGQVAGTAFIFVNMLMYLASYLLCLKIWRYQAARREMEYSRITAKSKNIVLDEIVKKKTPATIKDYPGMPTVEEREMYKRAFYKQYEEYKELHREISPILVKIRQLDEMMSKLPRDSVTTEEQRRIEAVLKKYEYQKKNNPSFLAKKERYDHLKAKLSI